LLVAVALSWGSGAAQEVRNLDTGRVISAGADVTVVPEGAWLARSRLWVSVDIHSNSDSAIRGPLAASNPFWFRGFSYSMVAQENAENAVNVPCTVIPWHPRDSYELDAHGSEVPSPVEFLPHHELVGKGKLRLLFAIPWPEDANLHTGVYALTIRVYAGFGVVGADADTTVLVSEPTAEQARYFNLLAGLPLHLRAGEAVGDVGELPPSLATGGVGFELLLHNLFCGKISLAEAEAKMLVQKFDPIFQPEIKVLRYEILLEQGTKEEAAKLRKQIVEEHPGLAYRLDDADNGNGIISQGRKMVEMEAKKRDMEGR